MDQAVGLAIDPGKDEPIYRQLFDAVVSRIESGAFPHGFKLPPSRTLARELAVHRNTVARTYADLEAAGFVSSTVGRGTFVEAKAQQPRLRPSAATGTPPPEVAASRIAWGALLSASAKPELLGRAERYARRIEGRDVVNMARMQPSLDLLPDVLLRRSVERVLVREGAAGLAYAPPEGVPALREQIAIDLTSRGVPASADDVLVTSGSQQALDVVARSLVNPGDAILVDNTTYSGAIDIFTVAGARLIAVPSDDDGPDMAALERLSRPDVKAFYVMPNGANPTGRTLGIERRRALVEWSRRSGIPLIEDDYGAGITLDDDGAFPSLRALDGDVIHVSTFSKRLAPALRLGYVVCPAGLRSALRSMKRVMDLGASAILQHALADFIERGLLRAHMRRILPAYRERRDALEDGLRRAVPAHVRWLRPTHGVVLWLRLPPGLDADAVYEASLRAGVLVSPSPLWTVGGRDAAPLESGVRLAFCAEPPERLALGARRIGKVLHALLDMAPRARPSGARGSEPVVEIV